MQLFNKHAGVCGDEWTEPGCVPEAYIQRLRKLDLLVHRQPLVSVHASVLKLRLALHTRSHHAIIKSQSRHKCFVRIGRSTDPSSVPILRQTSLRFCNKLMSEQRVERQSRRSDRLLGNGFVLSIWAILESCLCRWRYPLTIFQTD